jgi:DNA topoisomerase-1
MKLVIVESPAKAKTIGKYLGKEYRVMASVGHVRDLPKSQKKAIDIDGGFIPHYELIKGKEAIVEKIISEAKKVDEVLLATDPDREGEAIAWHIAEACKLKKPKRVVFHEITEEAVQEAITHPRAIDDHLKTAQEARRVLDRLFGYDLSGLIWKKVRYGLSAGRVQSPALRILVEREKEIRAFIPEAFWVLSATFNTKGGDAIPATCSVEPKEEKEALRIVTEGKKAAWHVDEVKETEVARAPRAPFTTSTLQQAASSRLGFSPSRTMRIAQKLYEAGHITYMRTDSTNLAKSAQAEILSVVEKEFGKEYVAPRTYSTKSKNAQEAHEAIRPTHARTASAGANPDEKKLYGLIRARAVTSQMTAAKTMRTQVVFVADKDIPNFHAHGTRILFPGWMVADPYAKQEDVILPKITEKEPVTVHDITSEGKETEPPRRYSEAGLVKELEKRGIGRPSTYAAIIQTVQDRGYVEKVDRSLKPTDLGEVVNDFLEANFSDYIGDTFTAEMEAELDEIADGSREYEKTLKDFYGPFKKKVKEKEKIEKITNLGPAPAEWKCPVCQSDMVIKLARNGKFMSCARFPECSGARTIEGKELEGPKETGEVCPECKDGKLILREGRFGMFIACSNYPKCKFIKEDEAEAAKKKTGVACPVCKKGEMVERRGRYGIFYSCSNYPDCKNAIKAKPTGRICSECGALMMEGTKTIPERCSNKLCPNHNPHKIEKKKETA